MPEYAQLVPEVWKERFRRFSLTPEQQETLGEYGFYMWRAASPTVADADENKYDGRLVILDDGSRWEVSSVDVSDVDLWSSYGKVVILDDVMYRLGDAEHADVTEEL